MHTNSTATGAVPATGGRPGIPAPSGGRPGGTADGRTGAHALWRFLPAVCAYLLLVGLLLAADTRVGDIARYTFYAGWGVVLPGTLVFRALRRRPHTLLEDLVFGAVTGLVLELAAWAVLVRAGLQSVAVGWPLAVVVPFLLVPRLRRHWRPSGYRRLSLGCSWSMAGLVGLTSLYYYLVFLSKFPVLATDEKSRLFGDMPYMLSLAANAKQHVPLTLPQVAGEPLHYHWFTFAHMAMTDMVGHIDLPVVETRLLVPAFAALGALITAVVAQRITGRAWAGPLAALLLFAVGEFTAVYPNTVMSWTFGAPAVRLMSWSSMSLTYSQPLLIALIGVVADGLRRVGGPGDADGPPRAPEFGWGVFVLAAMFATASSAAKASTLPVALAGLAVAGLAVLIRTRRIPWRVVGLGAAIAGAQLFATAVIFDFESYGLEVIPFGNIQKYWAEPVEGRPVLLQSGLVAAVLIAFFLNHQIKLLGAVPLLWRRRLRLDAVQWFLLGAVVAGPAAYLVVNGYNASYFTISAMPFGAVLSAWGYCEAFERATLPKAAKAALAVGAVALTGLFTWLSYRFSADWETFLREHTGDGTGTEPYTPLLPALSVAAAFAVLAVLLGLLWRLLSRAAGGLRRRGGVVLLTAGLTLGTPGLALDAIQAHETLWDGSWVMPASQVNAARWIRSHSAPSDILATNSHCWQYEDYADGLPCANYRSHWLSGYSERSVLIEGWAYAPRLMASANGASASGSPFWDTELFQLNEAAFYAPTPDVLNRLHRDHKVRYLVVQRKAGAESPQLKDLAKPVFDNGRVAVYELS
ncbi:MULTISPECIES: hypothetical protein [Streptomycetaceae]|uniref:hypothetical protein n=1 Tax=Streptomycetaceae TaxID=2062 RepID=UPI000AC04807|nr:MULTISPECIES: hypothetical protein [Streptomycetaceae]